MVTRYVNTASTAGGDGTTNATVGVNRAFVSISAAELALRLFGVADDLEILCCGSVVDTSNLSFSESGGYVTAGHTIYVRTNRGTSSGFHGGKWNDTAYVLSPTGGVCIQVYTTNFNFVIDGIQVYFRSAGYANCSLLYGSGTNSFSVKNSLFKCSTSTTYDALFTSWYYSGTGTVVFDNCVLSGNTKARYALHFYVNTTHRAYNCVINGCQYGVHRTSGTSVAKNCSVFNNSVDDFVGTITIDHCASDDGDGTNPISVSNWADQFYNASYETDVDFRLKDTSVLLDAGIGPDSDANVPTKSMGSAYRFGTFTDVGPFNHTEYRHKSSFGSSTQSGK